MLFVGAALIEYYCNGRKLGKMQFGDLMLFLCLIVLDMGLESYALFQLIS